jgi:hypothetical protein
MLTERISIGKSRIPKAVDRYYEPIVSENRYISMPEPYRPNMFTEKTSTRQLTARVRILRDDVLKAQIKAMVNPSEKHVAKVQRLRTELGEVLKELQERA